MAQAAQESISRRSILRGAAIAPMAAMATAPALAVGLVPVSLDSRLIAFGKEFDRISTELNGLFELHSEDDAIGIRIDELYDDLKEIESHIIRLQAVTLEGFRVKVRVAIWCLRSESDEPDRGIDPLKASSTTDEQTAWSIMRDLMVLYERNGLAALT